MSKRARKKQLNRPAGAGPASDGTTAQPQGPATADQSGLATSPKAASSAAGPATPEPIDLPVDLDDDVPVYDHDLLTVEPEPVSERELRALMKDWRRGRATRHLWDVIQDGYVALLAFVMIGGMIFSVVWRAQGIAAECTTASCQTGRTLLPWAALFGTLAVTLAVARLFGPIVASASEGFWLMDAPVRRSRLLSGRLAAVLTVSAVVSAVFGGLVAALTGSSFAEAGIWAAASALGAAGLTAFSAAEQGADRHWTVRVLTWLAGALGLAALTAVVAVAAGWVSLGIDLKLGVQLAGIVGGVGLLLLVACGVLAFVRLDGMRRARMMSGGSLVSGMQGAMFAMDVGLMRDILVERDAMERGHVRPTRGRGLGVQALVWRDLQRLIRFPKSLLLLVVGLVVPYAVGALGLAAFSPFISGMVLMTALVPLLGSLRVLSRTKGLARAFPFSTQDIRRAVMTVPAVLALIWAGLAIPAFAGLGSGMQHMPILDAVIHAALTGVAGLLAAVRWVTAKPADYGAPMMQTGMGAMPPGLMLNLFRGIDVMAGVTGPLLLGWSPWISVVIAVIIFFLLQGGMSMEDAQAMQEEQKKQMAELKGETAAAKGSAQKTRIPPPSRR
ncbi:MAG TPA: DUF6297 family protein [Propionibacteriaceae bacterium]|nr:DUF6297 family protein [Propionibacteriaceae bacterium]HQE32230.1 DUF6297 family protein [Propionibacteriaceae bacterium]